jgi:hypothetical protein
METIEGLAKIFSGARAELGERLNALREEQEATKRRKLQGIKNSLDRVQASYADLKDAVEGNKDLFEKPKTRVLHGIRVGWMKQRGKLEIGDEATCIAQLRKLLGESEAEPYIKTTEKPILQALANLAAATLKRCGVKVGDDVDAVVIKAANGDIDKLIDALIGDKDLEALAS